MRDPNRHAGDDEGANGQLGRAAHPRPVRGPVLDKPPFDEVDNSDGVYKRRRALKRDGRHQHPMSPRASFERVRTYIPEDAREDRRLNRTIAAHSVSPSA